MDLSRKSKTITIVSLLTIVSGIAIMLGWVFHITFIQTVRPALTGMKFNAALCFILLGGALLLLQYPGKYNSTLLLALLLLTTSIAIVTLSEDLAHYNSGLDEFFIIDRGKITTPGSFAGRMAFTASFSFSVLGVGFLMLLTKNRRCRLYAQFAFHIVTIVSAVALIGYMYGVSIFQTLFYITAMPVQTAILFFILSAAASLLNPSLGIAKLFAGQQMGNRMARRLFTMVILIIIIFGYLKTESRHSNLFSSVNIGLSVLAVVFFLISLIIVWNTATWLNKIDAMRYQAEVEVKLANADLEKRVEQRTAEFRHSEEKYHSLIEQASDAIYVIDNDRNFIDVNASMCKMTGYSREELLHLNVTDLLNAQEILNTPLPPISSYIGKPPSERNLIHKNGITFIVEINVKVFPDNRVMVVARDITERKRMEVELKEAELRFRTIADKSMVGVYIVQKGKFSYTNPRFAHIFEYETGELTNTYPLETIIHEDYRAITTEHVRRRMEGEVDSVNYETMGRKKDGTPNWVEFYGNRVMIGGEPAIIGSMIDITERKKAEEELKSSEQKYKLLFEKNPMPMWMIAKDDLSIIDANAAAVKLYGYDKEELLQMGVKSIRPAEDAGIQMEGYSMEMDGSNRIVRHLKKNGSVMFIELIAYDIVFEGRPVRLSLTNDITEKLKAEESLQKSEANLQAILKTTDTVYALFDQDLKVLTFNQKAIEFVKNQHDHTPEKGDLLADYFPPEKFPELNGYTHEVLKGTNVNYEADYPQADGSVIWYYIRLFPITNDNKEILGMLMALYDITERKTAEQDLKSAYGRIQNHIDSIKDMAWKQSHLIRSPLANLKGLTSMLKNDHPDPKVIEYIQNELNRMDSIIIKMADDASMHYPND